MKSCECLNPKKCYHDRKLPCCSSGRSVIAHKDCITKIKFCPQLQVQVHATHRQTLNDAASDKVLETVSKVVNNFSMPIISECPKDPIWICRRSLCTPCTSVAPSHRMSRHGRFVCRHEVVPLSRLHRKHTQTRKTLSMLASRHTNCRGAHRSKSVLTLKGICCTKNQEQVYQNEENALSKWRQYVSWHAGCLQHNCLHFEKHIFNNNTLFDRCASFGSVFVHVFV